MDRFITHARANRTIRLSLDTTWRGWPAVAPTDTSSCSRIDRCNRRNVLRWFTATEYQTGTPVDLFATTGEYLGCKLFAVKFLLRDSRREALRLPILFFERLKIEDGSFYWFLDICERLFVIFEISKNISRYICDEGSRVLSNKYWNFMINTHFMYLMRAVFGCGFATKIYIYVYLPFSCRDFVYPKSEINGFYRHIFILQMAHQRRVCFVSVYLTGDVFKAKSDDKEDFKSS